MWLKTLIEWLESQPLELKMPRSFTGPHSYRGYYEQLAFEPTDNATIGSMLADARGALGTAYTGYKGDEFTMMEHTPVWIANYGMLGEEIGPHLLGAWLDLARLEGGS